MFDLIFVSLENWDNIWRRNQFLCAGLSRRFPEMKILFVAPPRNIARSLSAGKMRSLMKDSTWNVEDYPNVTVTSPLRVGPERFRWGIKINEVLARRHIRKVQKRMKMNSPLLWLNPHQAHHLAGRLGERAVIYDVTDDWTLATLPPKEKCITQMQDRRLCSVADLVIVCSESLLASRTPFAKRSLLLPNAVDAAHYASVTEFRAEDKRRGWKRPVFGYTGTLHPDRTDTALVLSLARAYPKGTVVLIGPNHLGPQLSAQLQAQPNVVLHEQVPYTEIPAYMKDFDVLIVPHIESNFTQSLNPIKLWEYLAAGKPIATTSVAGFLDFPDLCHIGSGRHEFLAACAAALGEDGRLIARRKSVAAQHSWNARIDRLLQELKAIGCEA